ncbi:Regulatory protein RecX [compost metagenome]
MRLLKYSIYEIKQKLLQKGIQKDIIELKIYKLADFNYDNLVIEKIKLSKGKILDDLKLKQYLYKRGFKVIGFEEY